jgi:hypothetical protein
LRFGLVDSARSFALFGIFRLPLAGQLAKLLGIIISA